MENQRETAGNAAKRLVFRSREIIKGRLIVTLLQRAIFMLTYTSVNRLSRESIKQAINDIISSRNGLMYWNGIDVLKILANNDLTKGEKFKLPEKFWLSSSDLKSGYFIIDGKKNSYAIIVSVKEDSFLTEPGQVVKSEQIGHYLKDLTSALTKTDVSLLSYTNLFKSRKNKDHE